VGILCLTLSLGAVTACRTAPLVDPPPAPPAATPELTRAAIIRALGTYHYIIDEESPGRIRARMQRNSWTMVVEVHYGQDITVHYADSINLRYQVKDDVAYIHKNYNGRVVELVTEIERQIEIVTLEAKGLPAPPPPANPPAPATH
jgi:hypothetical protein